MSVDVLPLTALYACMARAGTPVSFIERCMCELRKIMQLCVPFGVCRMTAVTDIRHCTCQ